MSQNTEQPKKKLPEVYSRSQLTALYATIPITEDESKLLRKYCLAMVNLYGMVPLKQAWKIVMEQNPGQFTRKQLNAFANVARHERDTIMILGDEEVYRDGPRSTPTNRTLYDYHVLMGDTETFQRIRSGHQSKPYYIPEKKVLLRYHNSYYCQPTPESKALKAHLMELTGDDKRKVNYAVECLMDIARYAPNFSQALSDLLEDLELHVSMEQLQTLLDKMQRFHNTVRMPSNSGHTPDEIRDIYPLEQQVPKSMSFGPGIQAALQRGDMDAGELFSQILHMDLPNEEFRTSILQEIQKAVPGVTQPKIIPKVGRNDPCPCGSGKKFKRCCGR